MPKARFKYAITMVFPVVVVVVVVVVGVVICNNYHLSHLFHVHVCV